MRAIHGFINGITRMNIAIGRLISVLLYVIFGLLILEVFSRYMFGRPTVWTNELSQLLFGVYAVMSGAYVMAHREHVNVDLLYSHLSVRGRAAVDILTSAMFFLFTLAVLYFGASMAWEAIESRETSYSAWNPPIYPVKAAIPLAAFLLLLQGLVKLLQDILVVCKLAPDAAGHDAVKETPR